MSTDLAEFLDAQCEAAKSIFRDRGQVHPTWIIETKSGEILPVMTEWANDEEKDLAVAAVRNVLKITKADRYAFITEAWILEATKEKNIKEAYRKYGSLEHHPDRREVLMVTVEDRKETMMRTYYILRPGHSSEGPATLAKAEDFDNPTKSEGRFANLLPKDAQS